MAKAPAQKAKAPPAPPAILVIFGARGDLAKRLLFPSLLNLARSGLLDDGFKVLGVDHGDCDQAGYRRSIEDFVRDLTGEGGGAFDQKTWTWLEPRISYLRGDFEDAEAYKAIGEALDRLGGGDVAFYLATAPRFFGEVVDQLARAGLTKEPRGAFRRVVIEKPFGEDLASAKALNRRILKRLDESQIYRIDHFLGKETVRNIMVTRFANGVFEPLWSRLHIDHVQITAAETVTVEERGAFYDKTGALRDMVPNHLFGVLALIAMEPPNSFDADAVRAEKARVIEAITVQTKAEALKNGVRGQYGAGKVAGKPVAPYRQADKVARDSRTETYVALKLAIDNWRWAGVPFYLRTGKALKARHTEVSIQFKAAPAALFGPDAGAPAPNVLVLQIQPDEGVCLNFAVKQPGPDVRLTDVALRFSYADAFEATPATGYETLIYDCLSGDQSLFKRADDIEFGWRAVMPFLDAWAEEGAPQHYAAGGDGPADAEALLARDGRRWRRIGS